MAVKTKSRAAADAAATFRAQAKAERDKLMDTTLALSADEVRNIEQASLALETRAASVANFTADDEIEDQGGLGDGILDPQARTAPGREESSAHRRHDQRIRTLRANIEDAFGGPNSLILALARQQVEPLNSRQQQIIAELRTITADGSGNSNAEVLLPLQQIESIFSMPNTVGGIYESARRFTVRGRTLRIPYLVQTDATGSNRPMAGIADVVIVGEAGLKTEFEPKFEQRLLTVYKYAGYTELGDETLADDMTGDLAPTIQTVIGGQIVNKINEDVTMDGTGTSMPMGAFHPNNPSLLKVTRKTINKFTVDDVFNMYARHVLGPDSKWYLHPSVVPQFMALTLAGTTLVTTTTDLRGKPVMMLMGLPIVVTPLMAVLGAQADVALGNAAFYALAVRQALTIESSIHYKFRNDVTAYRFFARAGGIPIPDGTYSYKAATSAKQWEVSPFVVLDDVVTS